MSTAAIVTELEAAGFVLRVDDGRLIVSPGSLLTAEQRSAIAANKMQITEMLTGTTVPALLSFSPSISDTCQRGHTPLSRGGLACETCAASRCVSCGAWMGKPDGAFCAGCRALAELFGAER